MPTTVPPIPFEVDQLVKVTGHPVFAGRDLHGRVGAVHHVYDYRAHLPSHEHDSAVVVDLILLAGHDSMGAAVWDTQRTPVHPSDLAPLLQGTGDWVRGARVIPTDEWPNPTTEDNDTSTGDDQ